MGATGGMMLFGAMFTSIVTNDLSDIRRVRRTQKEVVSDRGRSIERRAEWAAFSMV
jgi:hypothetical protein